jgi:hypothetical protein
MKIVYTAGKAGAPTAAGTGAIPAGLDVLNIHYSFVIGEEALFRVGVEGHTAPQFIKKELGSAGTEDPLNQRQSIGWKIDSLGYKVANPDAVVAYMSVPSQYKVNVNARPDVKNQFTDYNYGFTAADGSYWHPEQVVETVVWDESSSGYVTKHFVRGTTTEVSPVKMTQLVKPINGGVINDSGKKNVVVGTVPTAAYCLASNHAVKFLEDQVAWDGSKYVIKGTAVEVVKLPEAYDVTIPKADGTGYETRTAVDEGTSPINKTGDPRID